MFIYIYMSLYITCMCSLFHLALGNEDGGVQLVYDSTKNIQTLEPGVIKTIYLLHPMLFSPDSQWNVFSLFLKNFHSAKPFNGIFCELGRRRPSPVLWEKDGIHLRMSAKGILFYFRPNSNRFLTRSRVVHDERAEWSSLWHDLCNET